MLTIRFACPNEGCAATIFEEVENAHYDWTYDSASDGVQTELSAVVCPSCDAEFTVEVIAKGGEKDVIVQNHPDIEVIFNDDTYDIDPDIDDSEYNRFLASYAPSDPYGQFKLAIEKIEAIRSRAYLLHGNEETVLGMVYLTYISALEAYLSDTLISIVTRDPKKLISLVGVVGYLRDTSVKLIDVAKDDFLAVHKTKAYLQEFPFHKLAEVAMMYKAVLGVTFIHDKAHEDKLIEIIKTRHHLVHRNGKDNDGKKISITDDIITDLKKNVDRIVSVIDDAYMNYIDIPF